MRVTLNVKDAAEARAVKAAWADKVTRTAVVIIGTLLDLPPEGRAAVMAVVAEELGGIQRGPVAAE